MLIAGSCVETERSSRYLVQLCRHFSDDLARLVKGKEVKRATGDLCRRRTQILVRTESN